MTDAGTEYLVVVETQKIKSFLFASPFLRETRGASILLDRLNRMGSKDLFERFKGKKELIYLGGGSGRLLFSDKNEAGQFRTDLRQCYHRETASAQVAVAVMERDSENGNRETIADWISRGVAEARKNKLARVEGVPLLAGRWVKPCSSCGQGTAEAMWTEFGEHYLCRSCNAKRQEVNHLYRSIKPGEHESRVLKPSLELIKRYGEDFIFTTLAQYVERHFRLQLPQDFDDIGRISRPPNYLGFIYADGNGMGEVVKRIGKEFPFDKDAIKTYRAFSKITDQATREAAVEAVLECVPLTVKKQAGNKSIRSLPAEFVMAGGDDLMLVVPAHTALDVAVRFIETYQKKTKAFQDKYHEEGKLPKPFAEEGLTTSAGVVIAHAHFPAHDLMRLAGELMKMAKAKAAKLLDEAKVPKVSDENKRKHVKRDPVGTLDFWVLHEAGTEPLKERRKKEYHPDWTGVRPTILTERPYTVEKALWLLDTIRDLKKSGAPRSKLKALYGSLFQNPLQARFDALRLQERLFATGDLTEGKPLFELASELNGFPFREEGGKCTTPMTEIIELYDFVHEQQETATSPEEFPRREAACD
jgi:hypothetical protein